MYKSQFMTSWDPNFLPQCHSSQKCCNEHGKHCELGQTSRTAALQPLADESDYAPAIPTLELYHIPQAALGLGADRMV